MRVVLAIFLTVAACDGDPAPPSRPPFRPRATPSFEDEPQPTTPLPPLDFAAYGDCRSNHSVHRKICMSMLRHKVKFVVVSGDLVDYSGDEEDWVIFRRVTKELRAQVGYYPAPGNHDLYGNGPFEKEFGLEKLYYDRRIGDVHLFLLNSNFYFSDDEQLRWLEEKAKASDARHKIASFHHPPFSIDRYGDFESKSIRERMHPILVRLGFCAAFCGHHHAFYATRREGVRYVVTAGGGAVLYEIDPTMAQEGDVFRKFHHYVGCRNLGKKITAQVFEPDGREIPELAFTLCEHP